LPTNLRPTTRECVHIVKSAHFRTRDKDGGHTVWSAISKYPMLHENFMALCFIEPRSYWQAKIAGIGIFDLFVPVTLTLIRYLSYTNLTRIPWRYTGYANMNFIRQCFRKLSSNRHACMGYRHDWNHASPVASG